MRRALLGIALVSLGCLTAFAAGAAGRRHVHPADRSEARIIPMYGDLPACEDPAVIGELTSRFNSREAAFWGPLQITTYDLIRETAFRPWGADFIPRRFCSGRVLLNDGIFRRVDYSVRENLGLFGMTWNLDWCVLGLDRQRTHAPGCQMARP